MISTFIKSQTFSKAICEELKRKTMCVVDLYVLKAFDLASRDLGSQSDPYLKITAGDTVFDERENYQLDTAMPKFNKKFTFHTKFPGSPGIQIEIYDYDDFFGDDLIGKTVIDLDDRYFSPNWQSLPEKMIE
jgi:Ca2+-dependent lipid-binding protein